MSTNTQQIGQRAMGTSALLPTFTGSMKRFSQMIRARVADPVPAPDVNIPEAAGATDVELARLSHRPARGLVAQAYRDGAWVHSAGLFLHR
jgi:hypothetical protein